MTDQSRVGLYLYSGSTPAAPVRAIVLSPSRPVTLPETTHAIAVYPDPTLVDTAVVVTAARPNSRREELIAFHPRAGWARRFWFREPLTFPRGTVLSLRLLPDPPAMTTGIIRQPSAAASATRQVTVNIVS